MFVAYHKESTKILRVIRQGFWQPAVYESQGACTRAINKAEFQGRINASDYAVDTYDNFQKIEKTETVINLMSKLPVQQRVNTPNCCDVSSETYWSM